MTWTTLALAVGGAFGALARRSVQRLVGHVGRMPLGTFVANVGGAFVLGLLLALVARRVQMPMWLQEAIFVGFLGGFTTFSALSAETFLMLETKHYGTAVAYAGGSIVAGVLAVMLGMMLGRWIT